MDHQKPHPAFEYIINSGVFNEYQEECKDLLTEFSKIYYTAKYTTTFLHSKATGNKKIHYITIFHVRVVDHFSSSLLLMSQGYIVNAHSLARSALEDLLVMINFEIDKDFFNQWQKNSNNFKISPGKLRRKVKQHPAFEHLAVFLKRHYSELSNLLHPKRDSVNMSIHSIIDSNEFNIRRFRLHTTLLVASFYYYHLALITILLINYPDDDETHVIIEFLNRVNKELLKVEVNANE